jgi:hypothetical protein
LEVRGRIEGEEEEAEADFVWGVVLGMLMMLLLLNSVATVVTDVSQIN